MQEPPSVPYPGGVMVIVVAVLWSGSDPPPASRPSNQPRAASIHEASRARRSEPKSLGWAWAGTVDRTRARTNTAAMVMRNRERHMTYPSREKRSPPLSAVTANGPAKKRAALSLECSEQTKAGQSGARTTKAAPEGRLPDRPRAEDGLLGRLQVRLLLEGRAQEADQVGRLAALLVRLLQLEQSRQQLAVDLERLEDRHHLRHGFVELLELSEAQVDLGQIEPDQRHLIAQLPFEKTLTGLQQRHLCGAKMAQIAQDLPFLPVVAQGEEGIQLPVELTRVEVEGQRLLGLAHVDVRADQVVARGEQQMRVAFLVDLGDRPIEGQRGGPGFPDIDLGDRLLDHAGGNQALLAELVIDAAHFIRQRNRFIEPALEVAQGAQPAEE